MSGQGKKFGKKSGPLKGCRPSRDIQNSRDPRKGHCEDVTLADYANSSLPSGKGRLRKAQTSLNVVCEVKNLNIQDKKLNGIEDNFTEEENGNQEEVSAMKKASRRKKTLSDSMERSHKDGNIYPLDIWQLLANYIRPEDVATFSAICRSTWYVVNTRTFWFNLYKRYYKNVPNLPARLQPDCMVRLHGLKACVVRSLFYMYPPMVARVDQASLNAPYYLKCKQCISMWQERHSNKWKISFKLRRNDYQPSQSSGNKTDLMDILSDINANADDGCTLLQVVSSERMMLPLVMGLTLHSINMSLGMNMVHMAVQLVFGSGQIRNGKLDNAGTVTVSLNSVLKVSVLDWWHPHYPHSNTIVRPDDT